MKAKVKNAYPSGKIEYDVSYIRDYFFPKSRYTAPVLHNSESTKVKMIEFAVVSFIAKYISRHGGPDGYIGIASDVVESDLYLQRLLIKGRALRELFKDEAKFSSKKQ
jgi:hypothetical protein